jgi:chemotaxis protein histidine kinase CheA
VHLLLTDDGAGMPLERIREQAVARGLVESARTKPLSEHDWLQFVFLPGFSTAKRVTNISAAAWDWMPHVPPSRTWAARSR